MGHCLRIMNRADMHKQIVCWKQWHSLKNLTPGFLKIHVLKRLKSSSKQEWIN
ncbi:putative PB1-F2 protein [Influenza A virus]